MISSGKSKSTSVMIGRLLRRNTSAARIAGFIISNLVGLAIMGAGLQFYLDARSLWEEKDSFLKSDYLAINKIVGADAMWGNADGSFSPEDIADLQAQPWVEKVGSFSKADFRVYASVALGDTPPTDNQSDQPKENNGRRMSTAMFFEAVPDEFIDLGSTPFEWTPDSPDIPIIISKDYLALYNFGFASSAGLPKLSESLVSGIPLNLTLSSDDGSRRIQAYGRVAGYSNRFNTILVPASFLDYMNEQLGRGMGSDSQKSAKSSHKESAASDTPAPSRLIVDVNSPGDAAIAPYLESKGWEVAGDKSAASAAFMLRIISGIIIGVGSLITILSLLILALSMSLLMEKNRRKLHSLLMLGIPVSEVARPYWQLTALSAASAAVIAWGAVVALRAYYLKPLQAIGAEGAGLFWTSLMILLLTFIIIFINCRGVTRRVLNAWSK